MKPKVYVDTSVFGGIIDHEFQKASMEFFERIENGDFILVTSPIVQAEIDPAPVKVRNLFDKILRISELVNVSREAIELRNLHLAHNILSFQHADDALHVALATVSGCSMIISWNFKHIVHYDKIPLYNAINLLKGHSQIAIYSPMEVV